MPSVILCGGAAVGRQFGPVSEAFRNGISDLIRRDRRACFLSATWGEAEGPHQTPNLQAPWSWTLEPWEINVCCLSHSLCGDLTKTERHTQSTVEGGTTNPPRGGSASNLRTRKNQPDEKKWSENTQEQRLPSHSRPFPLANPPQGWCFCLCLH